MGMQRNLILGGVLTAVLTTPVLTASQEPTDTVQNRMRGIAESLQTALLVAINPRDFQDPKNRQTIVDALDALSADAVQLRAHEKTTSRGFRLISRPLGDDARRALRLFEDGDFEGSRFVLNNLTNRCFGCHSRLPGAEGNGFGEDFFEDPRVQSLSPREQMTLAVAARRFNKAVELAESILVSGDMTPVAIDITGVIEDYLKIVLRVQSDLERPVSTLRMFVQRPDIPSYLRNYSKVWLESLENIEPNLATDDPLTMASSLIQHGQVKNEYPADRRGLVYFMVASSLLHRYVELNRDEDDMNLAEAFYLLGVIDEHISSSLWPSETELYLETAIRLAPRSPIGQRAYFYLEEFLVTGYTGSSGTHLPEDVAEHLKELRALIEPE